MKLTSFRTQIHFCSNFLSFLFFFVFFLFLCISNHWHETAGQIMYVSLRVCVVAHRTCSALFCCRLFCEFGIKRTRVASNTQPKNCIQSSCFKFNTTHRHNAIYTHTHASVWQQTHRLQDTSPLPAGLVVHMDFGWLLCLLDYVGSARKRM